MYRYYFFENKRVDGRMKLFPLPGQTTYANHGSTAAPEEAVDVDIEVQMNILDRALVCSYHPCTTFGVRMEGNSRRQVRLMAYSDRGRTYYKASGIVPILFDSDGEIHTSEEVYNENREGVRVRPNEAMIAEYRAYVSRQNSDLLSGIEEEEEATSEHGVDAATAAIPAVTAGRLEKVRSVGNYLADLGIGAASRKTTKYHISLLLDIMSTAGAKFSYRKQNGDLRNAVGTLCESIISDINPAALEDPRERQGADGTEDGGHVVYFDIEKQDWRSFCVEDFVGLQTDVRLPHESCVQISFES